MQAASSSAPPQPTPQQLALQVANGVIAAVALHAFAALKIADMLAAGPQSAGQLAAATSMNADALYRVLRAVAMFGFLRETAPKTFSLTDAGQVLRTDVPGSVTDMVQFMGDPIHVRIFTEFMHSVRTGTPCVEKATGVIGFEVFEQHREFGTLFDRAMTVFSRQTAPAVLEAYDFSGIGTLMDVAGGHGFILASILQKYPQMRGILFDLDRVLAGAPALLQPMGVADRVELASGDFFKSIPPADAYIMQHIIHDWDDDKAVTILTNCRKGLGERKNGKVIILDAIVPAGDQPDFSKLLDLEMLAFPGGRERNEQEFSALLSRAGLRLQRVVPTKSSVAVIEGVPV